MYKLKICNLQEGSSEYEMPPMNRIRNTEFIAIKKSDCEMKNLITAIKWALTNDEDVIYCICEGTGFDEIDPKQIITICEELVGEGIFSFVVDGNYQTCFPVNNNLKIASRITAVYSFVLIRPIFELILNITEDEAVQKSLSCSDLIKYLSPHSFVYSKDNEGLKNEGRFQILSPFRNIGAYITGMSDSLSGQNYSNFKTYFLDDCSTDETVSMISMSKSFEIRRNNIRKYALENLIDNLINNSFEPEDIICLVDGDDRLPHKYVIRGINECYKRNDIEILYSGMNIMGEFQKIGAKYTVQEFQELRKAEWKFTHLRTFKYSAFKRLLKIDPGLRCMRDDKGNFFKMPYDMALFFPLLEIVGYKGTYFFDASLYEYRLHELNDNVNSPKMQKEGEIYIRNMRPLNDESNKASATI